MMMQPQALVLGSPQNPVPTEDVLTDVAEQFLGAWLLVLLAWIW